MLGQGPHPRRDLGCLEGSRRPFHPRAPRGMEWEGVFLSGEDPFSSTESPGGWHPALLMSGAPGGGKFLLILQKLRSSSMLRVCQQADSMYGLGD